MSSLQELSSRISNTADKDPTQADRLPLQILYGSFLGLPDVAPISITRADLLQELFPPAKRLTQASRRLGTRAEPITLRTAYFLLRTLFMDAQLS